MKINPGSQTLITAGEQRAATAALGTSLSKLASRNGSVLQRLTIVASQPATSVLYLRADYAALTEPSLDASTVYDGRASRASSGTGARPADSTDTHALTSGGNGNTPAGSRSTGLSSYLRPVEQYARTQRILDDTPPVRKIDVHA